MRAPVSRRLVRSLQGAGRGVPDVERGEELEEQSFLSTTVCLLAQALYALERLEEADA
jgi:hypothetical protein